MKPLFVYPGIWGRENLYAVMEHTRGNPKLNVFCVVSESRMYGLLFFANSTVAGFIYLDTLEHFCKKRVPMKCYFDKMGRLCVSTTKWGAS